MTAIFSGIIGGIAAVLIAAVIARHAGRAVPSGQLRYGGFMWGLAIASVAAALLPLAVTLAGHDKEFWAKAALFAGFGLGAVYCFGEAACVSGSFDDQRIRFRTPWTGSKDHAWRDLVSVDYNAGCSWWVLAFKDGAPIRLSSYLGGHRAAVETALAELARRQDREPTARSA